MFQLSPGAIEGQGVYRHELPTALARSFDQFIASGDFLPFGESFGHDLRYDNPTLTGYFLEKEPVKTFVSPKSLNKPGFLYCIGNDFYPFSAWDYLRVKRHQNSRSLIAMFGVPHLYHRPNQECLEETESQTTQCRHQRMGLLGSGDEDQPRILQI